MEALFGVQAAAPKPKVLCFVALVLFRGPSSARSSISVYPTVASQGLQAPNRCGLKSLLSVHPTSRSVASSTSNTIAEKDSKDSCGRARDRTPPLHNQRTGSTSRTDLMLHTLKVSCTGKGFLRVKCHVA